MPYLLRTEVRTKKKHVGGHRKRKRTETLRTFTLFPHQRLINPFTQITPFSTRSKNTQMRLRKLKHAFLEYKIALESIVSCCEKIGVMKQHLRGCIKNCYAYAISSSGVRVKNPHMIIATPTHILRICRETK